MERAWYCTFHLVVTVGKTLGTTLGLRYQAHNCIFNYIDKNVLFYDEVSGLTINAGDKACAFLVLSVEFIKPRLVLRVKCVDLNSFYFFEYANFFDLLEPVWRHEMKTTLTALVSDRLKKIQTFESYVMKRFRFHSFRKF